MFLLAGLPWSWVGLTVLFKALRFLISRIIVFILVSPRSRGFSFPLTHLYYIHIK
jgi:hypothetical protein